MKNRFMRMKNKKGFTLLEVVIALALVSIICSLILPLTSSAMTSFTAAQTLRDAAASANKKMSMEQYNGSNKVKTGKTLYVTVKIYDQKSGLDFGAESKFSFSQTSATGGYDVTVTYYNLEQKQVTLGN